MEPSPFLGLVHPLPRPHPVGQGAQQAAAAVVVARRKKALLILPPLHRWPGKCLEDGSVRPECIKWPFQLQASVCLPVVVRSGRIAGPVDTSELTSTPLLFVNGSRRWGRLLVVVRRHESIGSLPFTFRHRPSVRQRGVSAGSCHAQAGRRGPPCSSSRV